MARIAEMNIGATPAPPSQIEWRALMPKCCTAERCAARASSPRRRPAGHPSERRRCDVRLGSDEGAARCTAAKGGEDGRTCIARRVGL